MWRVLIAGCLIAGGCTAPDAVPDVDAGEVPPDARRVALEWIVAAWTLSPDVTVRMNGAVDDWVGEWLPDDEHAADAAVVIDGMVDGLIVSREEARVECDDVCGERDYAVEKEYWKVYESGEVRHVTQFCDSVEGECVRESFEPRCRRGTCPGARCGIDRVAQLPSRGWLDCVPVGAGAAGDACSLDANGVDDCGSELHCIDGTCRVACEFRDTGSEIVDEGQCATGVCEHVVGMSSEVGVCS